MCICLRGAVLPGYPDRRGPKLLALRLSRYACVMKSAAVCKNAGAGAIGVNRLLLPAI